MRRPRRHKMASAGVFFLVYAVLHVMSQKSSEPTLVSSVLPETMMEGTSFSPSEIPAFTVPSSISSTKATTDEKVYLISTFQ